MLGSLPAAILARMGVENGSVQLQGIDGAGGSISDRLYTRPNEVLVPIPLNERCSQTVTLPS